MAADDLLRDRLAIALIKNAHVSIWAADREHKIVLWNSGAEKIYGHSEKDALGKDYLALIVDEVEREQSAIDCRRIIDTDYRQHNCIAYDHDTSGRRTHMLTNCFRIVDPATGEHYQAEIGVEITDLNLKLEEHRALREVGIEHRTRHERTLELRRQTLIAGVERMRLEVMRFFGVRQRDLERWLSGNDARGREVIGPTYKVQLAELRAEEQKDMTLLSEFKNRVASCKSEDELDKLHVEWDDLHSSVFAGKSDL